MVPRSSPRFPDTFRSGEADIHAFAESRRGCRPRKQQQPTVELAGGSHPGPRGQR